MNDIVIKGTPPAKSNSYQIIKLRDKTSGQLKCSIAKSGQVKNYEKAFYFQLPRDVRGRNIKSNFGLIADVSFERSSSDLDNAFKIILDSLQASRVIYNDNLCEYILARKRTAKNGKVSISIISPALFEKLFEMIDMAKRTDLSPEFEKETALELYNQIKRIYETTR